MTGDDRLHEITDAAADRAVERSEPGAARRVVAAWVAAGMLVFFLALGAIYFLVRLDHLQGQADANAVDAQRLYEQVEDLGAEPVVEPDPPGEVDDPDPNDPESQDDEVQDSEQQDSEVQDPERQEPEVQDPELADPERDDPEVNDPDPDDPEVQDEEIQDPEVDDPPVPGPQGPEGPRGEPGPTCPDGYTAESRRYDPSPVPGDEETWWVCVQDSDGG